MFFNLTKCLKKRKIKKQNKWMIKNKKKTAINFVHFIYLSNLLDSLSAFLILK